MLQAIASLFKKSQAQLIVERSMLEYFQVLNHGKRYLKMTMLAHLQQNIRFGTQMTINSPIFQIFLTLEDGITQDLNSLTQIRPYVELRSIETTILQLELKYTKWIFIRYNLQNNIYNNTKHLNNNYQLLEIPIPKTKTKNFQTIYKTKQLQMIKQQSITTKQHRIGQINQPKQRQQQSQSQNKRRSTWSCRDYNANNNNYKQMQFVNFNNSIQSSSNRNWLQVNKYCIKNYGEQSIQDNLITDMKIQTPMSHHTNNSKQAYTEYYMPSNSTQTNLHLNLTQNKNQSYYNNNNLHRHNNNYYNNNNGRYKKYCSPNAYLHRQDGNSGGKLYIKSPRDNRYKQNMMKAVAKQNMLRLENLKGENKGRMVKVQCMKRLLSLYQRKYQIKDAHHKPLKQQQKVDIHLKQHQNPLETDFCQLTTQLSQQKATLQQQIAQTSSELQKKQRQLQQLNFQHNSIMQQLTYYHELTQQNTQIQNSKSDIINKNKQLDEIKMANLQIGRAMVEKMEQIKKQIQSRKLQCKDLEQQLQGIYGNINKWKDKRFQMSQKLCRQERLNSDIDAQIKQTNSEIQLYIQQVQQITHQDQHKREQAQEQKQTQIKNQDQVKLVQKWTGVKQDNQRLRRQVADSKQELELWASKLEQGLRISNGTQMNRQQFKDMIDQVREFISKTKPSNNKNTQKKTTNQNRSKPKYKQKMIYRSQSNPQPEPKPKQNKLKQLKQSIAYYQKLIQDMQKQQNTLIGSIQEYRNKLSGVEDKQEMEDVKRKIQVELGICEELKGKLEEVGDQIKTINRDIQRYSQTETKPKQQQHDDRTNSNKRYKKFEIQMKDESQTNLIQHPSQKHVTNQIQFPNKSIKKITQIQKSQQQSYKKPIIKSKASTNAKIKHNKNSQFYVTKQFKTGQFIITIIYLIILLIFALFYSKIKVWYLFYYH